LKNFSQTDVHVRVPLLTESFGEIEAIRDALIKGEKSGFVNTSVEEIWEKARVQKDMYEFRITHLLECV